MSMTIKPIIMNFPLKGEWSAPNTPGTRIPSHGTNALGTRYAYDFLQVDQNRRGNPCYEVSFLHYLLFGVEIKRCYCYGKPIYAPCDGIVVEIEASCKERKKACILSDLRRARKNGKRQIRREDMKDIAGNYIIIKHCEGVYAAFCHLQPDSIQVNVGQTVKTGDTLACIGHTGNSFFPHLHFQLMERKDMTTANGIMCAFQQYQTYSKGCWIDTLHGIPKVKQRIRNVK